jgi:hypothetical protein
MHSGILLREMRSISLNAHFKAPKSGPQRIAAASLKIRQLWRVSLGIRLFPGLRPRPPQRTPSENLQGESSYEPH